MTTMSCEGPQRQAGLVLWAMVGLVLVVVFGSVARHAPGRAVMPPEQVFLPELTEHALVHADSKVAHEWVGHHGAYCRYDCPDARTRYVCGMPDGRWAVVVLSATEKLITAFTTDQDYARGIIDGCSNPWRYVHP